RQLPFLPPREAISRPHLLRACSRSSRQEDEEGEVNRLQAGVEFAFAVFPEPSTFFSHAKVFSTTHRRNMTAKVCSSLRLATCTVAPNLSWTAAANVAGGAAIDQQAAELHQHSQEGF